MADNAQTQMIKGRALALRGARLAAIQNCYSHLVNPDDNSTMLITEKPTAWLQLDEGYDDEDFDENSPTTIQIDQTFYKKLVKIFATKDVSPDIASLKSQAQMLFESQERPLDSLLQAIILIGLQELNQVKSDKQNAVINEYVTLASSFYQQNEPALINRILQDFILK